MNGEFSLGRYLNRSPNMYTYKLPHVNVGRFLEMARLTPAFLLKITIGINPQ